MKVRLLSLTVLVLVALVLVPVSAQGTTFVFASASDPVALDASIVTDGESFRVIGNGCDALLAFEGSTTVPGPSLAASWEASDDGLVWTFQLVENAMFHDGSPFNAEAVVFNFERWRFTDNPYHFPEQTFEYYEYMFGGFDDASLISSVEATGEFEVTFTLVEPNGSFLNTLAMTMFTIASPAAIMEHGLNYGTPSAGFSCTGPYKFVEWTPNTRVVLERNENYWGDFPGNVDTVIIQPIVDPAARFAALQSGQIQGYEGPTVEDLPTLENSDSTFVLRRGALNTGYLAFNYRIQELRDVRVRQAISMAMDRAGIVAAFFPAGAEPAATFVPPSLWGFNPDISLVEYDPDAAMALLAEAGYPDGISEVHVLGLAEDGVTVTDEVVDTIPLTLYYMPITRFYNPQPQAIGEAQASFLADIGIEVQLDTQADWATYLSARSNGELLGMYQLGWGGDNGDPDNFLGYFFSQTPRPSEGFYDNQEVSSLLRQARAMTDTAEREPVYQQVEQMLHDDVARLWIAHLPTPLAFSNSVSGYITNPLGAGNEPYRFVTVE